jgi:hypothetical protein
MMHGRPSEFNETTKVRGSPRSTLKGSINNIKQKKIVKIKKQSYFGLQRQTYVKVVTRLATTSHIIILMLFLFVLILC